jgi:hypothetical protein
VVGRYKISYGRRLTKSAILTTFATDLSTSAYYFSDITHLLKTPKFLGVFKNAQKILKPLHITINRSQITMINLVFLINVVVTKFDFKWLNSVG